MRPSWRWIGAFVTCLAIAVGAARADDPPRLEPTLDAAAGKAHAWTSAGGLRYTWVLPDAIERFALGAR